MKSFASILIFIMAGLQMSSAQYVGIYPGRNTDPLTTTGPAYLVEDIVMTMSGENSSDPTSGPLSVSASYTENFYSISDIAPAGHMALMFGGLSSNTKTLGTKQVFVPYNDVGAPEEGFYDPVPGQSGMNTAQHYAFEQYASVEFFQDQVTQAPKPEFPTLGTHKMGEITYTFSERVMDPVLHLTGLGGIFGSAEFGICLFSVRYRLKEVTGGSTGRNTASLQRLDGTARFRVEGDDIFNDFSQQDYEAVGSTSQGVEEGDAGTGSVLVTGELTSVTFEVFMDGKTPLVNGVSSNWTSVPADGVDNQRYSGDRFNSSWSLLESSILPIELISFSSTAQAQCGSKLDWSTSAEINASHFEVEVSEDGLTFAKVGTIDARGSNSNYSFYMDNVSSFQYVRLRLVDLDGAQDYSDIISLEANCSDGFVSTLFPNPVYQHQRLHLDYSPRSTNSIFNIVDIRGKVVARKIFETKVDQRTRLDFSLAGLSPGTYFLIEPNGEGRKFIVID